MARRNRGALASRARLQDHVRARVGLITLTLSFPGAASLKDKRGLVRPVIDGIRRRFECSVAEISGSFGRNSSVIAAAVVGRDVAHLDRTMASIADEAERYEARLEDFETEVI